MKDQLRVGGASGFWGDNDCAVPQFLEHGRAGQPLDFIVFDFLAEITMAILARAREADAQAGYATDFVTAVIEPHIRAIADQQIRLVSNAGGVNPSACADAVRRIVADAGLDLTVAVIEGDDVSARFGEAPSGSYADMFAGAPLPDLATIMSANAYLGAFPIAAALDEGADIVITGRCVDSAVTLGPCLHAFGWGADDWDRLAAGSLAGHIIECGTQATGGNFTDWRDVGADFHRVGYPIATIDADGGFTIGKPDGTTGIVSRGTVGEQMLYEIGNPRDYLLPDVTCDFADVELTETGSNRVRVAGARGRPPPADLKVSVTHRTGWKMVAPFFFAGPDAGAAARAFARAALEAARAALTARGLADFSAVAVDIFGGANAETDVEEVTLKIGVHHEARAGAALLLKEATGLGLSAPPGLSLFAGTRPRPSPVVRLHSTLVPREEVDVKFTLDNHTHPVPFSDTPKTHVGKADVATKAPAYAEAPGASVSVALCRLAFARSGDKGDMANIGVLPRDTDHTALLWDRLTPDRVRRRFARFLARPDDPASVKRFFLPGTGAINFLLHGALGGGGVASLRNDPQGKSYAQLLLGIPIDVPERVARDVTA